MAEKTEKKAAAKEAAPTSVRVENRDGEITLVFGDVVHHEEEEAGFKESDSVVISRDDAVQLAADLPTVAQEAMVVVTHSG